MDEIIDKKSTLTLIRKKQFYGIIIAPDGQRFRFDLSEVIEKLSDEDFERIREYAASNYEHGKDLYEKAVTDEFASGEFKEYFEAARQNFLDSHEDAHKSGQSSAKFYLAHQICQKALEEMELKIYSEESKEEWQEAGCILKYDKKEEKRRNEENLKFVRDKAYLEGYDKGRAEERAEQEKSKSRNKKSFWRWFDK